MITSCGETEHSDETGCADGLLCGVHLAEAIAEDPRAWL